MIIVTAGHVDHGKTALIQALTGTHTAHLPEEKKRGLTIDLGYAYLPIENDILGFIDVPGHQKFLANMLAGLGGIEHALLIISAEEGIKPQTKEHLAILQLLHFRHIIVVITKADRVPSSQITSLTDQLLQRYPFLNTQTTFVTSAYTGFGIKSLKHYLISLNQNSKNQHKPFRYAIDRIFNIKGAGLVVTGTAIAGKIKIGDEFYLSTGTKVRIKNIHAQNKESKQGIAGQRLALNLANVDKQQLTRGDWILQCPPEFATDRITVKLHTISSLKETSTVHLYHYASHITAKLSLLTAKQAVENEEYFAEILLDTALHITVGDKLILRSGDDSHTLAGAEVLEIGSPKRYKRTLSRLEYLHTIAQSKHYTERIAHYIQHKAIDLAQLAWSEQLFIDEITQLGYPFYTKWLFTNRFKQEIQQRILEKLQHYHTEHNDQLGVTKARLYRITALEQPEGLIYHFIDDLLVTNQLAQTRGWLHTPEHCIEFTPMELIIWAKIKPLFEQTNQALWVREVATVLSSDETEIRNLLYKAGKLGYLVPIVKDRFLLHEQIIVFANLIRHFIEQHGEISVNQLRDEIQYGRKLTVQLIEYFDRTGFLRRKGNIHLLRDRDSFSS